MRKRKAVRRKLGSFRLFALFLGRTVGQGKGGAAAAILRLGLGCGLRLAALALWLWLAAMLLGIERCLLGLILGLLGCRRRHDTVVMLRMLKIVLGHHPVAAGIGVAGQLQILLVNVRGRAANLHFRTGRIVRAVGIEAAAVVTAAAAATTTTAAMLRPAAASA